MNVNWRINNVFFEFAVENLKTSVLNFDDEDSEGYIFVYFHQCLISFYLDESFFKEKKKQIYSYHKFNDEASRSFLLPAVL